MKKRLCYNDDLATGKCRFSPVECCSHTRINVHRMSVTIPLEQLCKDKLNNKLHLPVISAMVNVPSFILAIQISEERPMMSIEIRKISEISFQHFVLCKITAFNEENSSVLFKSDNHLFSKCEKYAKNIWNFPDFIEFCEICASRKMSLSCEFAISVEGEEYHTHDTNMAIKRRSDSLNIQSFNGLTSKFQNLSQCPKLTDAILTCEKQILCVHKNVLSANSSVFTSLFTENSRVISAENLKPNILHKILTFMYTNHLEDFEKDIYELYSAAHKYQVLTLMQYCIEHLKIIMSTVNIYEILMLADTYNIIDLFSAVETLIQNNAKEVLGSSKWADFSNKKPTVALKVSQSILMKVMHI